MRRYPLLVGLGISLVTGWAFYFFGFESFLRSAYAGTSWEYFNQFAANWRARQSEPSLFGFMAAARGLAFRVACLTTLLATLIAGVRLSRPNAVRSFFEGTASPFNLAILRVFFFATLLAFDVSSAQWYAQLPSALQHPPAGLGVAAAWFPTDPGSVRVVTILFRFFCLTGLLGLFSRSSAALVVLLGFYLLGLPQLYGKVNHYHHLLWIGSLLAASRCGDVLAVDAFVRAWRHPSLYVPQLQQLRGYALPFAFLWLLIGVIYFFPGFWKLANGGLEWAFSANLKHRMHTLWFSLEAWEPLFRLDRYPFLYQSGGLIIILFEIGFLFCAFFPSVHRWAIAGALGFHAATALFLHISFWTLIPFLLALLDWSSVFQRIGRWRPAWRARLQYDPDVALHHRVAAAIRSIDLFDLVSATPSAPHGADADAAPSLEVKTATGSYPLWTQEDGMVQQGLLRAAWRLPAGWPFFPLCLILLMLHRVGHWAGHYVTPNVSTLNTRGTDSGSKAARVSTRPVVVVGTILLTANVLCGVGHVDSWPFSVYPTFAVLSDSTITTIEIEAVDESGQPVVVYTAKRGGASSTGWSPSRLRGLTRHILRTSGQGEQREKLRALWAAWSTDASNSGHVDRVLFYEATYRVAPSAQDNPPVRRNLLATLDRQSPDAP